MMLLGYIILGLLVLIIILIFMFRPQQADVVDLTMKMDKVASVALRLEQTLKEDFKTNREELSKIAKDNREELNSTLMAFKTEFAQTLSMMSSQNTQSLQNINQTLDEKVNALMVKVDQNNQANRTNLAESLKDFVLEQRQKFDDLKAEQREMTQKTALLLDKITAKVEEKLAFIIESEKKDNILIREAMDNAFKGFQLSFDKNVDSFNQLQREKFALLEERQNKLVEGTEKKLEQIRVTVDEKLQKTLNERLGQSFELVGKQLESVQKGLGEMQVLAQDVGGLKKVLSNVKLRGGIGEVQLEMLLEQILAPEQYEKNVKTKAGSNDSVEFAIKLPGRDDNRTPVWLPIDAKFPKDVYQQLQTAYDGGDNLQIELAQRMLDMAIKKMAKDIHDKYIDPPNTTDFGIMFLPFEGIYGEVVRKASLLDDLQRTYRIVVTGPTTLAAILNSLQMGFKTMAIQQRTSEVWKILGAVKKEFELFGGLLDKAQNNIQLGLNQLDDVVGKRTRAIQRKLKSVESLSAADTILILEETAEKDLLDEEEL
jgi:DNA recombination protein RmuC